MSHRRDHYELAFEDYLRGRGWPYVAVDEARRKAFAAVALKNFDYIVYSSTGANLLVDVKGRKFPNVLAVGRRRVGRAFENWITRDDLEGLGQWERIFGGGFRAVLVFAYWLQGPPASSPMEEVHVFQGRHYVFAAIGLDRYVAAARPRSARWQTLTVPTEQFRSAICDVAALL
ncbi:MAG: HYExAFE family protein [Planctomycetes bacterium]|nr:HYExAFE family protein [Planctomycetota bacterium]